VTRRALDRAFDESALYDDDVRAASFAGTDRPRGRRSGRHALPALRAQSLIHHHRA
jgi:hypothetical protein